MTQQDKLVIDEVELYKAIAYAYNKTDESLGQMARFSAVRDEVLLLLNRYDIRHKQENQQLADTMRENEKLRSTLQYIGNGEDKTVEQLIEDYEYYRNKQSDSSDLTFHPHKDAIVGTKMIKCVLEKGQATHLDYDSPKPDKTD